MIISLVVAAATNNGIGKDGKMPWHLPNDMKHFKNVTWGLPVIMGRKTFESLGKPLVGRKNIVISRQPGWKAEGEVGAGQVEAAGRLAAGRELRLGVHAHLVVPEDDAREVEGKRRLLRARGDGDQGSCEGDREDAHAHVISPEQNGDKRLRRVDGWGTRHGACQGYPIADGNVTNR